MSSLCSHERSVVDAALLVSVGIATRRTVRTCKFKWRSSEHIPTSTTITVHMCTLIHTRRAVLAYNSEVSSIPDVIEQFGEP
eukprot:2224-Heterococcus_DN1.PRE.3